MRTFALGMQEMYIFLTLSIYRNERYSSYKLLLIPMKTVKVTSCTSVRLVAILVAMLGIFSCSQRNIDYARVIPNDAEMVVALELEKLYDKSGLDPKALPTSLESGLADHGPLLDLMYKGKESGVALNYPLYLFVLKGQDVDSISMGLDSLSDTTSYMAVDTAISSDLTEEEEEYYEEEDLYDGNNMALDVHVAVVAKLSDRDKFEKMLLSTESLSEVSLSENYKIYSYEGSYIVIDQERVLVLDQIDLVPTLMAQSKEQSFIAGKAFEKMEKQAGDIRLSFPLNTIFHNSLNDVAHLSAMGLPTSWYTNLIERYDLDKIYWLGSLAFEPGKAVLDVAVHSDDDVYSADLQQSLQAILKPDGAFHKFFAKESLFFAHFGIDGARLLEYLMSKQEVSDTLLEIEKGIDLKGLLSSIKGDVTLGMSDIDLSEGASDFRIYMQLEDEKPLRAYIAQLEQSTIKDKEESDDEKGWGLISDPSFTKIDDDNYLYHNGLFGTGFSFKDKRMCLSLVANAKSIPNVWEAVSGDDISDQPLVKPILNRNVSVVYNNLATLSSPALAPILAFAPRKIVSELRKISGLRSYSVSGSEQRLEILMADEKTNALKQLVGIIEALAQ